MHQRLSLVHLFGRRRFTFARWSFSRRSSFVCFATFEQLLGIGGHGAVLGGGHRRSVGRKKVVLGLKEAFIRIREKMLVGGGWCEDRCVVGGQRQWRKRWRRNDRDGGCRKHLFALIGSRTTDGGRKTALFTQDGVRVNGAHVVRVDGATAVVDRLHVDDDVGVRK